MITTILAIAVSAMACFILTKFVYRKDTEQEARHKHYIELAAILKGYGLKDIPAILIDFAVKDYSDAYKKVKFWVELMKRDPNAVLKEFDAVYDHVSAVKIANPESRALLKQRIAEAEAAG